MRFIQAVHGEHKYFGTALYKLAELLGAEVATWYERGSIILTSNDGLGEWGELMGETVIASAILDRLLHHSQVLNIRGESYRTREERHANLFPSQQRLGTGQAEASDNYRDCQNRWAAMNLPSYWPEYIEKHTARCRDLYSSGSVRKIIERCTQFLLWCQCDNYTRCPPAVRGSCACYLLIFPRVGS